MKINSGEYKYRNIEVPANVRPTTEKVREAVASMIMDRIPGAKVLDLFAGSGSMGLELLSRGAEHCVFNERSRQVRRILESNIVNCGAESRCTVKQLEFERFLETTNDTYDIIFLDPPYMEGYYEKAIGLICSRGLLNKGGLIVAEHLYDNILSVSFENLTKIKEKKYGTIGVDVFTVE